MKSELEEKYKQDPWGFFRMKKSIQVYLGLGICLGVVIFLVGVLSQASINGNSLTNIGTAIFLISCGIAILIPRKTIYIQKRREAEDIMFSTFEDKDTQK
jgi:hypothetical protein